MKKEDNAWSEGVMMICTKCHKSIRPKLLSQEGNSAENLKMFLKKSLKEKGALSQIRVITSSCLDICIDDYQAVTYAPVNGKTESFIVHPEKDREELLEYLSSFLQKT